MRLLVTALLSCSIFLARGQSVAIRNVSHPNTKLEVGNTVEVKITGAPPGGTVTVVENGGSPFTFGTTDGSGDWSVSNVETSGYIGSYNQGYVNGFPLTPLNPDATFLPYAPRLPAFQVYGNFGGSNCPGGTTSSTCGGAVPWIYSPVAYRNNSASVDAPTVASAASAWTTAAGGKISVTGPGPLSQVDLSIYNGSSLPEVQMPTFYPMAITVEPSVTT